MALDTFMVYAGVYDGVDAAKDDYDAFHVLHVELGEHLDNGQAGPVVVAASDSGAKVEAAMAKADRVDQKPLSADVDEIKSDATSET